MKRLLLLCLLSLSALCASAQTDVYVLLTFEGAQFGKMSLKEMLRQNGPDYESLWTEQTEQMRQAVIDALNAEEGRKPEWRFGTDPKSRYLVIFVVERVEKGGDMEGRAVLSLYSPHHQRLFYETKFHGNGDKTRNWQVYTPRALSRAAAESHKLLAHHLKKEEKALAKKK